MSDPESAIGCRRATLAPISQMGGEMGQKFVPELHDPNYRTTEGQKDEALTEDEAKRLFDAMIARLDAEQRGVRRPD